jgi:hypothetical protein
MLLATVAFALTLLVTFFLGPGLLNWQLATVCFVFFLVAFLIAGKPLFFGFGNDALRRTGSWFVGGGILFVAIYALWSFPSYMRPI